MVQKYNRCFVLVPVVHLQHLDVLMAKISNFLLLCLLTIHCYLHSDIYPTRCNVTQFIYLWKLLYNFRVVFPPIIRSAYNCIYSIWYLSNRYCYLPLSLKRWNCYCISISSTIATGSSNGLTSTRCCRYSCMRS